MRRLWMFALCWMGCSSGGVAAVDAGTRSDVASDVDAGPPREADGCPVDEGDAGPRNPALRCVRRVEGQALGLDGMPLANHVITVCGPACFASNTDVNGRFDVAVDVRLNPAIYSVQVHGRPTHASRLVVVPAPVDGVVRMGEAIRVPRYAVSGDVIAETGGGTYRAGMLSVTVPASATVEFDLEDFELMALGRTLRHAVVSGGDRPDWAVAERLTEVYALGPFNLTATAPMGVTLPNTARLASGAAVEFVTLGNDYFADPPTAGRALVSARGHVSADGQTVTTDAGEGIRVLTWVGVRLSNGS